MTRADRRAIPALSFYGATDTRLDVLKALLNTPETPRRWWEFWR